MADDCCGDNSSVKVMDFLSFFMSYDLVSLSNIISAIYSEEFKCQEQELCGQFSLMLPHPKSFLKNILRVESLGSEPCIF